MYRVLMYAAALAVCFGMTALAAPVPFSDTIGFNNPSLPTGLDADLDMPFPTAPGAGGETTEVPFDTWQGHVEDWGAYKDLWKKLKTDKPVEVVLSTFEMEWLASAWAKTPGGRLEMAAGAGSDLLSDYAPQVAVPPAVLFLGSLLGLFGCRQMLRRRKGAAA